MQEPCLHRCGKRSARLPRVSAGVLCDLIAGPLIVCLVRFRKQPAPQVVPGPRPWAGTPPGLDRERVAPGLEWACGVPSRVFPGHAPRLPGPAVVHAASPLECEVPRPPGGREEAPSVARQRGSSKPVEGGSRMKHQGWLPGYSSRAPSAAKGLNTGTSAGSKCRTLRVTTVSPCSSAVAAMSRSALS